ncbi:E3 ubiquitin/ISG15 ligase TRIM25-like [Dendropsophus ebraccatus]|uniref:E3 ubiquitin/ISG15 ligase TRIM25-like n=1 Tax=Dendropsophus ebraccatus TaxID=150705 RepID=UPI003832123E
MASADLRDELLCSICISIFTDPVTLRCGHNFCRGCIDQVLNTQDGFRHYFCPECRTKFHGRPSLQRNITLHKVAERFLSTQPDQGELTGICCTYCIYSPVPAVKSCLHCEASLCDDHLRAHSKSPEHVLTDPSTSLEKRKCSVHKKVLEYYCTVDNACICITCSLSGEHQGHRMEMLDEASEKKKKRLRNLLQKLMTKREKTEERVRSVEERWRKAQDKASGEAERVTELFTDIRRRLDDLKRRVMNEILRQEDQLSLPDVIQKLEIKKDELSRRMRHIEELCNMADPLTVLQEPDTGDLCDPEGEGGDEDTGEHDGGDEDTEEHDEGDEDTGGHDDIDVDVITGMLHAGISDIITYLQTISLAKPEEIRPQPPSVRTRTSHTQTSPVSGREYGANGETVGAEGEGAAEEEEGIYGEVPADIILDINTASNNLLISRNLKTATRTTSNQNRVETAKRFEGYQVMGSRGFSSGRHYWDVDISGSGQWRVGVCYPSIDRRGHKSYIGYNNKSWCLYGMRGDDTLVIHDSSVNKLPQQISSDIVRICLDYEAGQLYFYELCDHMKPICAFTPIFTEPLHPVLCVYDGSLRICSHDQNLRIISYFTNLTESTVRIVVRVFTRIFNL